MLSDQISKRLQGENCEGDQPLRLLVAFTLAPSLLSFSRLDGPKIFDQSADPLGYFSGGFLSLLD